MRKFTFGSFAIGHGTNYNIESVEGLSTPGIGYQDQKAPYQDGATYIDNLLDVREIVIEGAIVAHTLSAINTARDAMIRGLNPKNSEAWLTYEADGVSKRIKAVGSVVFSNKQYQDAFQRFQVTFRCNDPMWQDLTGATISLPTSANSTEAFITSAAISSPNVIQLTNGNLFIAYKRNSDGYLVSKTYNGSTWSAESVINAAISESPCSIQKSNGNIVTAYLRASDYYIVSREYNGSTWSGETVINNAASAYVRIKLLFNGNIKAIYSKGAPYYLAEREFNGSSWGSENVITSAATDSNDFIQLSNGYLYLVYRRSSDGYLVSKTYNNSSWSTETVVVSASAFVGCLYKKDTGAICLLYVLSSPTDAYIRENITETPFTDAKISVINGQQYTAIQKSDGSIFIAYRVTTSLYLGYITRSITPVNAAVTGHVNTPILVQLNGPSTNPRIINNDTLEYIRLNKTLATGDYFIVNTAFGQKSIELWSGGIKTNGLAYLDLGSTLFDIAPGDNTVYYEDDSVASTATATMTWTERYIGV